MCGDEERMEIDADPINNLEHKPVKSILKKQSSFVNGEKHGDSQVHARFDEMNILATYHPEGKNYGHMKIDEPKTPYSGYMSDSNTSGEMGPISETQLEDLHAQLSQQSYSSSRSASQSADDSDEEPMTEEEKRKHDEFLAKRKQHYNFEASLLRQRSCEPEEDESD